MDPLVRRAAGIIPIKEGSGAILRAIRAAREALRTGDLVCIFPEGGLTRTGQMQDFRPGFLSMIKGTAAPVVPVYLGGLWGSIFSFEGGRFFWKWPRRVPYPVTSTSARRRPGAEVSSVRRAVEQLGTASHAAAIEPRNEPAAEVPADVPPRLAPLQGGRLLGRDLTGAKL